MFQYYHTWNYILKCVRVFLVFKDLFILLFNLRTRSTLCYYSITWNVIWNLCRLLAFVIFVWMSCQMWLHTWWKSHVLTNCHEIYFICFRSSVEVILICKNWWCKECCYLICINLATAMTLTLNFTLQNVWLWLLFNKLLIFFQNLFGSFFYCYYYFNYTHRHKRTASLVSYNLNIEENKSKK